MPWLAALFAAVAFATPAWADDPDVDGVDSTLDNCPAVFNPLQADCNHDGVGDACNLSGAVGTDGDRDGVCDPVDNCMTVANVDQNDCDGDGFGDLCEATAAQRDDDRDGVCNGVDTCPREAGACAMQAITVPWVPANPSIPHPTYSGATHTLKGIARYGGNQFMWDFGDGSPPTAWTNITSPYNLGVGHVYSGVVGQVFIATLSVRDGANPAVVATAPYRVKIGDSGPLPASAPYAMEPARMDERIDMAIDQGLWWLHTGMTRGTYADGSPGYAQPYGTWSGELAGTCTALDAFLLHGSKPNKDYATDPYVETVQRALDYLVASNTYTAMISNQTHAGVVDRPDYDLDGVGLYIGSEYTYRNGICGVALASTGTPNRQTLVGANAYIHGHTYRELAQDMAEWFAFGQADSGTYRGGWRYNANDQQADGSTNQWPLLAIKAAEDNMAILTPAFVRAEAPYFMTYSRHTALDNRNGGWGYQSGSDVYVNHVKTAAGILYHNFMGDSPAHPEVEAALGFLYRYWSRDNYEGGGSWNIGLGNSYAMYGIMKAMRMPEPDILRVVDYDYVAGHQTANGFDWYYTPPGQTQEGLATNLVRRQSSAGSWSDTIGANAQSGALATGWDVLILQKGVTIIPPQAAICNCGWTWDRDQNVTMDGSCSTHPDLNRHIVSYEWDFHYGGGTFDVEGTGVAGTLVGGFPAYGSYPVALRVTDDNPASLGGPQTSIASCNVTIKPPNNCPHPVAGGPYLATHGVPIQLDASASFDPDGDPLTFAWDLDQDGVYDDAFGATPWVTFDTLGTFGIAVQVTDEDPVNGSCTQVAFATVEIGNHAPVADPGGPYSARPGQTILLDGTGSFDPDGDAISFGWDLDNDGTFGDSTLVMPPFTVPPGTPIGTVFAVCLKVTDELGRASEVRCTTVTVLQLNTAPVCTQPQPAIVAACTGGAVAVTVDGSLSQDPDGDPLTFAWTTDCPGGVFADPTSALTTLTLDGTEAGCALGCTATLVVSDGSATTSCARLVDVIDSLPPSFTVAPADQTIECTPATPAAIDAWLASATAVDACTDVEVASDLVELTAGCGGATGEAVVTWTATDTCGNAAQTAASLAVVDTTAPIVSCPAPVTVECSAPVTPVALAASAADACFGALPTSGPTDGVYPVGISEVTFTAVDDCGNPGTCSSTVTVVDTTAPTIACPADVVAECDAHLTAHGIDAGLATAVDACGPTTVTSDAPITGTYPLGATTVTHTAVDAVGNPATCASAVTVIDTTPPVFDPATLGPQVVLGNCDGAPVAVTWPTATDLCQAAVVSCAPLAGTSVGTHIVPCTATDPSGNVATVGLPVTVVAPLRLAFVAPLADDNLADDPATDGDALNLFKPGSTVPHHLRIYACSGADVTTALAGAVTLRLTETYRSATGVSVPITPVASGVGGPGGRLVLTGSHWAYNLDTNRTDYPAGSFATAAYFTSLVTLTYDAWPAVVAAREDARLESR